MKTITRLILDFPHGASIKECAYIAQKTQDVIMAGVSEGGMMTTNKYGLYGDNVTFSDDTMNYVFGYNRNQSGPIDGHPPKKESGDE